MISISTIETAAVCNVVFEEAAESRLKDMQSRVSRTATLDGGAEIVHSGVSAGDRTLDIRALLSEAQADDLQAIFETETLVVVSCREGCFKGAMDILNLSNGELAMKFLVKEQLN